MTENEENLRDLSAMFAMNGLIARETSGAFDFGVHPKDPWRVARWAYDVADQMMLARKDKNSSPIEPFDGGIAAIKKRKKDVPES